MATISYATATLVASTSPKESFLSTLLSEFGDATDTYDIPLVTEVPIYQPSSSSSDSSSNSHGVPPWAIGLIAMAGVVWIAFKIWIKHLIRKNQKRSYQNHLATEPHLTFEEFREREMEQAQLVRDQAEYSARTELRATFSELGDRREVRRQNAEQSRQLRMKRTIGSQIQKGKER